MQSMSKSVGRGGVSDNVSEVYFNSTATRKLAQYDVELIVEWTRQWINGPLQHA